MKRPFLFRRPLTAVVALIAVLVLFNSCKKENSGVDVPVAGLMAFNLAPDKSSVGITLSGNQLTNTSLNYTSYTGGYLNIYPGDRSVKSYSSYTDSAFATSNHQFAASKYYSLFVVGNNGTYKNLVVHDDIDSLAPQTGKAFIRYVNAIPDSTAPAVSISAGSNNVVDSPASFGSVSAFTAVNTGEINISVEGGDKISADRTITLEEGRIYTVLLMGIPGASDTTKTVQIKYILNGQI